MSSISQALAPPARLGVVGSGQLGRMFVQAAQRMGYRAVVLSSDPDAPASQVAHDVVLGRDDDLKTLRTFAARTDAITVEFENVSAPGLRWLGRRRLTRPGWRTVWVSQNRLREKSFLTANGVPLAPWAPVLSESDGEPAAGIVGLPLILKTAASGYDGKGQIRVENAAELGLAWKQLGGVACVAEGVVTFVAEVSVVAARGVDGTSTAFPVGFNRHARHILDSTLIPAPIGPVIAQRARDLAREIMQALGTVGVLTVEFFLTEAGDLLVNELAPRPHNSGHWSIEGSECSQFDQQVRALAGLPLGPSEALRPAAMVNLLGDLWASGEPVWAAALQADPGVHLHLYGKADAAPGRKMGHLTVLDVDSEAALARALAARDRLSARPARVGRA